MAMIEREKFNELASEQSRYCVSIYVPNLPDSLTPLNAILRY
ncbi:MAG: hypothetical protein AB7V25_08535 [Mangrovibacterium sp.]